MATALRALLLCRLSPLPSAPSRLLRPLTAAVTLFPAAVLPSPATARGAVRCFSAQPTTSSLRDSSPNWSNRPPKETILLDGCDFEHWLVVMEPPPGDASNPDVSREEIIDSYIKTLAQVVGSEEEARMKIYSVSTRHYFAFGALVSEELSYKLKELPKVRWVLPDSYLDVRNKDYGGEPFINGEAVPYDPKFHEEWVRNNARANERSRRNDRPRNFDRSRNFERRDYRDAPPAQGFNSPPPGRSPGNVPPPPPPPHGAGFNSPPLPGQNPGNMPPPPPRPHGPPLHGQNPGNMPPPPPPPHGAGGAPNYQPQTPNPQAGYAPGSASHYQQGGAPDYQGGPPGYQGGNQGYQGNPGGSTPAGPGPAYDGYQGGGPAYQGVSNTPYSANRSYSGGAPGYQGHGGNSDYQ